MAREEGITFVLKVRDDGTAVIEKASGSMDKLGKTAQKTKVEGVDPLTSSVKNLGKELLTYAASYFAINQLVQFTKSTYDTGRALQATQKAFQEITGSAKGMKDEFAFLRDVADRTGQSFYDLTDVYKGFLAASKGTSLEGEKTRKIFESVVKASATLGLTSENTRGALYAIQQMMSKGVVSAEELRQQLGERLPGAYNLMAEAMGVSVAQLQKMLEQGQVLSTEALPKLAAVLEGRYSGAVVASTEAVNKLDEAWKDFQVSLSEAGFADAAVAGINKLTTALKWLGEKAALRSVSGTYLEGLTLSQEGLIDLDTFQKASFTERQKMVDNIKARQEQLDYLPSESRYKITKTAPGGKVETEAEKTARKKLIEDTRKAQIDIDSMGLGSYDKEVIRINSEYEKQKKIVGKTVELEKWKGMQMTLAEELRVKDEIAINETFSAALQKMQADEAAAWEKTDKEFREKVVDPIDKGEQDMYAAWVDYERKSADVTAASIKEKQEAYKEMYDGMTGEEEKYYDIQLKILGKQRDAYEALTNDKISADKFYEKEKKKLDQNLTLSSNKFFKGISVGYQKMLDNQMTWAKSGEKIFNTFQQSAGNLLSEGMFDLWKGDLKDFSDYFEKFADGLVKTVTQTVAEMAVQEGSKALVSGLSSVGGWAGGAVLDWLGEAWPTFHAGSYYVGQDRSDRDGLKEDELYAKLQRGEMIVPKEVAGPARSGDYSAILKWLGNRPVIDVGNASSIMASESYTRKLVGLGRSVGMGRYDTLSDPALMMSRLQMATMGNGWAGIPSSFMSGDIGSGMGGAISPGYSGTSISSIVMNNFIGDLLGIGKEQGMKGLGLYAAGVPAAQAFSIAAKGGVIGLAGLGMNTFIDAIMENYGYQSGSDYSKNASWIGAGIGSLFGPAGAILGGMLGRAGGTYASFLADRYGWGSRFADSDAFDSFNGDPEGAFMPSSADSTPGFRYGGKSFGPESGYTARLHGTEVIVSQKADYPVKLARGDSSNLPPVQLNINIDGKVLARALYKQSKNGIITIHTKGITDK